MRSVLIISPSSIANTPMVAIIEFPGISSNRGKSIIIMLTGIGIEAMIGKIGHGSRVGIRTRLPICKAEEEMEEIMAEMEEVEEMVVTEEVEEIMVETDISGGRYTVKMLTTQ